jgi:hypothetical protein
MEMNEQPKLTPSQVTRLLEAYIPAGNSLLIVSGPGIGKSSIVEQTAEKLGYDLMIFHPVVSDPTDFKGMPWVLEMEDGSKQAVFLPFNDLERLCKATGPTMAFLDDIGQAPPAVQAALMQLLLARRINGHKIGDQVVFVGATNRKQDKAGVKGMLEPVKSRWQSIVHMEADVDDWARWATKAGMSPELVAFIRKHRPELLHKFEATAELTNSPCPRGWENLDKGYRLRLDADLEIAAFSGAVGQGPALEFKSYLQIYRQLELPENILANPTKARVPKDPSVLWATVTSLARHASDKNMKAICEYAGRVGDEYSVLLIKDCIDIDSSVTTTRPMLEWAAKHADVVL